MQPTSEKKGRTVRRPSTVKEIVWKPKSEIRAREARAIIEKRQRDAESNEAEQKQAKKHKPAAPDNSGSRVDPRVAAGLLASAYVRALCFPSRVSWFC